MEKNYLKDGERLDDLQIKRPDGGPLCVIQNPDWFCFGVDAVLLANFAEVRKKSQVLDIGTGCGVIPLLIASKTEVEKIIGLEIQAEVAEMAQRSVLYNNLGEKIKIVCEDINQYKTDALFDTITCNPPYKESGGGLVCPNKQLAIARHEIHCTLSDIISASSKMLKDGGKLNLIHRPERLADIFCSMRENNLEPKRLRFVHPSPYKTAKMVLVEGAKNGRPKVKLMPPLYVHNENGEYSDEINQIYNRAL